MRYSCLYESCERDHELQHPLQRVCDNEFPLYLGTSDRSSTIYDKIVVMTHKHQFINTSAKIPGMIVQH